MKLGLPVQEEIDLAVFIFWPDYLSETADHLIGFTVKYKTQSIKKNC